VDNPNIRYYGIVRDAVYGSSYCTFMIQIIYPDKGIEQWNSINKAQKKRNYWSYGKEDIYKICDLNTMPDNVRRRALMYLM
jgi:hypothetical protein